MGIELASLGKINILQCARGITDFLERKRDYATIEKRSLDFQPNINDVNLNDFFAVVVEMILLLLAIVTSRAKMFDGLDRRLSQ